MLSTAFADIPQVVEDRIGNAAVPGPSPGISSIISVLCKNICIKHFFLLFFCVFIHNVIEKCILKGCNLGYYWGIVYQLLSFLPSSIKYLSDKSV